MKRLFYSNWFYVALAVCVLVTIAVAWGYAEREERRKEDLRLNYRQTAEGAYDRLLKAETQFNQAVADNDHDGCAEAYKLYCRESMVYQGTLKIWLRDEKPGPLRDHFQKQLAEVEARDDVIGKKSVEIEHSSRLPNK